MHAPSKRSAPLRRAALVLSLAALLAWAVRSDRLLASVTHVSPQSVGILYPTSGPDSQAHLGIIDTIAMALDEINQSGGLLGRQIVARLPHASAGLTSALAGLQELSRADELPVIFGGGTPAMRRLLLPEIKSSGKLFFHSGALEGLEVSPNIVYTRATPNQEIIPVVRWAKQNLGSRFVLVGSDTLYSGVVHEIIADYLDEQAIELVGRHYLGAAISDLQSAIHSIAQDRPDAILSTLTGPDVSAFFQALRAAEIEAPTISFGIARSQLRALQPGLMLGEYLASSYFDQIDSKTNRDFVERFRARHPDRSVITSEMQSAYVSVHLWAAAVRDAQSFDSTKVRQTLADQSLAAPEGIVYVDSESFHLWQPARLAQILPGNQMKIVWASPHSIRPRPFPDSRLRVQWDELLEDLSEQGNSGRQAPEA